MTAKQRKAAARERYVVISAQGQSVGDVLQATDRRYVVDAHGSLVRMWREQ